MAAAHRWQIAHPGLMLPLLAFLLAFYGYPVVTMLMRSVAEPHWTLGNFGKVFASGVYLQVLWITLRVAVVVTVASLLLGYPVAYVLARIDPARSNLLMSLILIPFWTSILVRTYAWMVLLGREGFVNQLLMWTGTIGEPLRLLNTTFAVYVAMVHILLPFMVLPLYAAIRAVDEDLLRAAEGLGASRLGVFRQVVLPLSLPGVAAGCLLVFILALGFFITPALVGGPRDLMIAVLINQQVDLFDWPFASALAVLLLAAALLVYVVFARSLGVEQAFGRLRA
jgi:ABC-type spermidine/putrescine transport system permease subunit I